MKRAGRVRVAALDLTCEQSGADRKADPLRRCVGVAYCFAVGTRIFSFLARSVTEPSLITHAALEHKV